MIFPIVTGSRLSMKNADQVSLESSGALSASDITNVGSKVLMKIA
jgi:hypothetical protein